MQNDQARGLRTQWAGEPCDHPDFDKEYYLGSQTGDYVCTTCGKVFFKEAVEVIEYERDKKRDSSNSGPGQ